MAESADVGQELAHELVHVARWDSLWQRLQQLLPYYSEEKTCRCVLHYLKYEINRHYCHWLWVHM